MKGILISFGIWLGVIQIAGPPVITLGGAGELIGVAGGLAGLTVMVYRLGVWRQEMYNTKHDVAAEVARYREESSRDFKRLEQRLTVFDQYVAAWNEQRVRAERWQVRVDTTIEGHEKELTKVADRLQRLEGDVAA